MIGYVDKFGRALISVPVSATTAAAPQPVEAWIDTGFNGELVLPQATIDSLELPLSGTLKAILADGTEVAMRRYVCFVNWFGNEREIEVVANDGNYPLLGVGLLVGFDLHISYRTATLTID